MKNDQDLKSTVRAILEDATANGRDIPSIRAIRSLAGWGSLGTISETVNAWKQEQLQSSGVLPLGFDTADAKKIVEAVWSVIVPVLKKQIESVEQKASARIEIEREEAAKIREAAEDVLTTVEEKDRLIERLNGQVREQQEALAKLQGALDEARRNNEQLQRSNDELHSSLDQALQEAAKATAALDSTRKLLPFLDPNHLDKLNDPQ